MIVATQKCGCPPKEENSPCSPCCGSGKKKKTKRSTQPQCPGDSCCNKEDSGIGEPPPCCPTEPSNGIPDSILNRKVRSEIAERGLPYKELEAVINNNRLVIRTQKIIPREEYDPPCDCTEDSQRAAQDAKEDENSVQAAGNRMVSLYPNPRDEDDEEVGPIIDVPCKAEENPNIFLLRVKKKCRENGKGYNIDLEFKTPRPWSMKKRREMELKEMSNRL